jgi:hypothetical protein
VRWDFGYCGHYWPIVPAPDNRCWWLWRNWCNEDWQGKSKYSEKTCPSATLSTTNTIRLYAVLNPGRRGGKPASNRLIYGAGSSTAYLSSKLALGIKFRTCIQKRTSSNVERDNDHLHRNLSWFYSTPPRKCGGISWNRLRPLSFKTFLVYYLQW